MENEFELEQKPVSGESAPEQPAQPEPETQEQPAYTQPQAQEQPPYSQPQFREPPAGPQPRQFEPSKTKPKKKGWTTGKVIALVLCCSLLSGVIGAAGISVADHFLEKDQNHQLEQPQDDGKGQNDEMTPDDTQGEGGSSTNIQEGDREETTININRVDTDKLLTAAEVYAQNVNSTVGITTTVTTGQWGYQSTGSASGSGFILTEDGYILTNHHVIEDASAITVSFYNGESLEATLVGYDVSNDIAVLKVEAEGLTPVVLGKSSMLNVGDTVIAIGNPLGELTFSLTSGVVSALERNVTFSDGTTMTLIQTDCAINSGNSGGALFNLYGEVVGITNAKYSGTSSSGATIDNIGFAIPIDTAREIAEDIIENGYISSPYIGVTIADVSDELQAYGLPEGAAVQAVTEGGPAAEGGLKVSDIITRVNGEKITGASQLKQIVMACEPGDVLRMTVYRQGETIQIRVTVGEQIQSATGE